MPRNLPISNKQDSKENSCISLEWVIYDKNDWNNVCYKPLVKAMILCFAFRILEGVQRIIKNET